MYLASRPRSRLTETLRKAHRLVDPDTGVIKLLHEAPLAPDAPRLFGFGSLCSDFAGLGFPSESDVSGSTSIVREQSMAAAIGEAVERYSASYVPYERIHHSPADDLDARKVDPESVVLYSDAQYEGASFPFSRFEHDRPIGWTTGYSLGRREKTFVPAFAVYQPYLSERREQPVIQQVTTGLACGNTLEEAVLSGLCEVVERDASMLAWLRGRPLDRLDLEKLPAGLARATLARFGSLRKHVVVLDATNDLAIPSYIAVWNGPMRGQHRAIFCSCAKPDADAAAAGALRELAQCMMWVEGLIMSGRDLPDPLEQPISEIEEHVLWPLRHDTTDRYGFLLEGTGVVNLEIGSPAVSTALDSIDACMGRLLARGLDAVAVDVTSPDIAEVGLHVARVVIPGAQPLYFGSGLERLSARALAGAANLNLHPHPFP